MEEFPSQSRQLFWNSGSEEWKGYFSVFYWFKQMKPHYKASLLRLLIDELSYCRYEKRDNLSADEQH